MDRYDAAGYGWSMDTHSSGVNLVSAITHEFGHLLGFEHDRDYDVMAATLAPNFGSFGVATGLINSFAPSLLTASLVDESFRLLDDVVDLVEIRLVGKLAYHGGATRPDDATARLLLPDRTLVNDSLLEELAEDLLHDDQLDLSDSEAFVNQQ